MHVRLRYESLHIIATLVLTALLVGCSGTGAASLGCSYEVRHFRIAEFDTGESEWRPMCRLVDSPDECREITRPEVDCLSGVCTDTRYQNVELIEDGCESADAARRVTTTTTSSTEIGSGKTVEIPSGQQVELPTRWQVLASTASWVDLGDEAQTVVLRITRLDSQSEDPETVLDSYIAQLDTTGLFVSGSSELYEFPSGYQARYLTMAHQEENAAWSVWALTGEGRDYLAVAAGSQGSIRSTIEQVLFVIRQLG